VNAGTVATDVLLVLAAGLVLACSIGVLVMRDVYQRVHFVGPISMVAPILVALAVTIRSGWNQNTGETWLAIIFLVIASPYLSHATIRAARIRDRGDWRVLDDEPGRPARRP
jgi:monovalent cation/proton antiporter MnhG/PhaG subunit